jgi:hypothetical protein
MSWSRARLGLRLVALVLVAIVTIALLGEYAEGRRAGELGYRTNLWLAVGAACAGVAALFWPRVVACLVFPIALVWLGFMVRYAGDTLWALVVGGVPLVVCALLFVSGVPPNETSESESTP